MEKFTKLASPVIGSNTTDLARILPGGLALRFGKNSGQVRVWMDDILLSILTLLLFK